MPLPKRYDPRSAEPRLQDYWSEAGTYHFSPDADGPVYSIDTPPPTVSGRLHLGHIYSYSHADFAARFWRMSGHRVFYPMGYDDNGLPTEHLVERELGIDSRQVGREAFAAKCLQVSADAEAEYRALWQRLGLSVDWRYTYRTIGTAAQRASQWSFLDLYRRDLVYRQEAPVLWCPGCGTAIAQAELDDLERESVFFEVAFRLDDGAVLPVATTRPELLPACVAVFVHPDDPRFLPWVGRQVRVPLSGQEVPLLADTDADPDKGTGAVMCCTFGDTADVAWWKAHGLPLISAIGPDGRMTEAAQAFAGLSVGEARERMVQALEEQGQLRGREPVSQAVRVHERCDTPVEYLVTPQWFVRVLDFREQLLDAGEHIKWHPAHMQAKFRQWVENLGWDWCISRQRSFGVPFPVWYCASCEQVILARYEQLPADPRRDRPSHPCACGSTFFVPETDVLDTWATSSLTPQIAGGWLEDDHLYQQVFPMSVRPLAHEIIRTWAFYALVKSLHHFGTVPWQELAVSGWGLAPAGQGKISKSRGGGPRAPLEMMQEYSADALRYWAASTGLGKDALISEDKMAAGVKLTNKLWNTARFSQGFLNGFEPSARPPALSPADAWILSRTQRLVQRCTEQLRDYDYASAKSATEAFFWRELADNYLEMAKKRLYDESDPARAGAQYALGRVLLTVLKLFAPFMPHVTEEIFQGLFAAGEEAESIHRSAWPVADEKLIAEPAEVIGEILLAVATGVRRYKTEHNLALGTAMRQLQLLVEDADLAGELRQARADIMSVTRAREVLVNGCADADLEIVEATGDVGVRVGV